MTELRRPGRHRHREHAAAQRIARTIAGAADCDVGGVERHQLVARRVGAGISGHAGERGEDLRSQVRLYASVRWRGFHAVALLSSSPAYSAEMEARDRYGQTPDCALGRVADTGRSRKLRTLWRIGFMQSAIRYSSPARTRRHSDHSRRPDAKGQHVDRCNHNLSPGGSPIHRQTDRAGTELRRPGGDRHREHAAAQRIAAAHRRLTKAGAADGDQPRCSKSFPVRQANWSRCSVLCWRMRHEYAMPSLAR